MLIKERIGVDDILAMLLALSSTPEELEVMMISVTYGNVPQQRYDPADPAHPAMSIPPPARPKAFRP